MSTKGNTTTNDVFESFAKKGAKLCVRMLDKSTVLIEGDPVGLEFLGNLFLALARSNERSVQFSPQGAGKNRFTKKSTTGFYLHKAPCEEPKLKKKRSS
jgi:hypothetical protein